MSIKKDRTHTRKVGHDARDLKSLPVSKEMELPTAQPRPRWMADRTLLPKAPPGRRPS